MAHVDVLRPESAAGTTTGERLGYRPALDGLRAVAISLVVVHHTSAFLVPTWSTSVFPGGFLGVDLFLVLSGFLITTLLLERRDREPRPIATFYLRRALRLLPAVIALLLVVAVVTVVAGEDASRLPATFVVVLTYTTNWAELAGVHISPYVTHLWSLAIEEQFYLVWPLALFGVLHVVRRRSTLVGLVIVVAVAFAAWRAALWESGEGWLRIYIRTDARADALLLGAALALAPWSAIGARVGPRARTVAGAVALAGLVAVAELVQPSSGGLYLGGLTAVAGLAALAIAAALAPGSAYAGALSARPLVGLGRISYGLYLWHFPVFLFVAERAPSWPAAARVLVGWTVALGATIASYRLLERPALRLKGRLAGRLTATGAPRAPLRDRVRRLTGDRGLRGFAAAAAGGSLVALVLDVWMLLAGQASLTRSTEPLGGFMDLQGRAILHGTLAVDPVAAGFEGFVTGGKTYVYFGVVPSLLRLPVLAVTHGLDGRLTQLSMLAALLALLTAGAALHWRVRGLLRPQAPAGRSDYVVAALAQFALGAGAIPLYLAGRAVAYHEAELWGAALALAALATIVGVVARPSARGVAWAGLFSTLAINTRFSVGLAPIAALSVLALGLTAGLAEESAGPGRWWCRPARLLAAFGPPARGPARLGILVALGAAVLVPLATYAAVSEAKFDQPFGLPLSRQVDSRFDLNRRATLQANGGSLFGAKFTPTTVLQLVRPDAVGSVRAFPFVGLPHAPPLVLGSARFDTLEQSLSASTSMPLLVLLTLVGLVALVRQRRRWPLLGVLVASATGCAASLTIAYVATRYLADLLPCLAFGGLVGLQSLLDEARLVRPAARVAMIVAVAALALAGTVTNFGAGLITQRLLSAESPMADRAAFVADQDAIDRALGRRPHGVRVAHGLSRPSVGAPGDLLILDRCAGLYATGIAGSWVEIERTSRSGVHPLAVTLPPSTRGRAEPLVTLGKRARRVTATVRVKGDRAVYGIAVGGRQAFAGTPLPASRGRPQHVVLSVDPLGFGHVAALRVDGRFVGAAGAVYDRRAPVTLARDPDARGTATRFTGAVRALPTPAPLCRRIARRAGLPAR